MKPCDTRSRRSAERRALLATLLLLGGAACVSRGTYDEDMRRMEVRESAISERLQNQERSNDALTKENVQLSEALEDMRLDRDELASDVEKLNRAREILTGHLRDRDSQVEEVPFLVFDLDPGAGQDTGHLVGTSDLGIFPHPGNGKFHICLRKRK